MNDVGVATDGAETGETPADEAVAAIGNGGGEAIADAHDISTPEGGEALIADAPLDTWGRIDIVVNNAGIGRPHMVFNLEDAEWGDVLRRASHRHVLGQPARVPVVALREHKAGRGGYGRLVNTSTGLLLYGGAGQSNYVAAKAGVAAFTDAVATEMAPYGVTANTIMPSARTRLANVGWRIDRAQAEEEAFDPTDPVHVAEMVCYFASPGAGWLSGQCFQVRGGMVEHVRTWEVDTQAERHDRGFTAVELAHRDPPPVRRRRQARRSSAQGVAGAVPEGPLRPVGESYVSVLPIDSPPCSSACTSKKIGSRYFT